MRRIGYWVISVLTIALCATSSFAQDGKLKIKVTPKEAYVFVDGKAIRDKSQTIALTPGKHIVAVVNYGYKISTQDVNIDSGKTTALNVTLDAYGGPVSGPFGQIEIKGDRRAAVLLNGKTPAYFVGNVDEFDWDWLWHQLLLVAPGTHHVTVTRNGNELYSGDVTVAANQKVTIDINNKGAQRTREKKSLAKLSNIPRYKSSWASDTIAVAPVTGSFSASSANINCGQSSTLTWQSGEAVDTNISGIGPVASSGTQSVSPHATTTYDFSATGPGGTAKGSSTVEVNTKVDASLTANPAEVHYRRIGDKVVTQDSSTLTWTTTNADSVSIDPIGKVDPSGSQAVKAEPTKSDIGPVDESKNYTLSATNVCGGSATQTAALLHIVGSIEPIPEVVLQSVFYPTDYPDKRHPQVGLVRSQQLTLATLAAGFKKYLEYDPDAKLSIEAYADIRGSKPYNQNLSERRVERIKQYLVDQGITADKIQTAAYGKERPIDRKEVKTLEETNPNKPPKVRLHNVQGDWLAYNRRADVVLLPSGKKSALFFPHTADDSSIIWQVPKPPLTKVEKDQ